MEHNFSKLVLLSFGFFIALALEKPLDILLGLGFAMHLLAFFMQCFSTFMARVSSKAVFVGAIGFWVWATIIFSHNRVVVNMFCFVAQTSHITKTKPLNYLYVYFLVCANVGTYIYIYNMFF